MGCRQLCIRTVVSVSKSFIAILINLYFPVMASSKLDNSFAVNQSLLMLCSWWFIRIECSHNLKLAIAFASRRVTLILFLPLTFLGSLASLWAFLLPVISTYAGKHWRRQMLVNSWILFSKDLSDRYWFHLKFPQFLSQLVKLVLK